MMAAHLEDARTGAAIMGLADAEPGWRSAMQWSFDLTAEDDAVERKRIRDLLRMLADRRLGVERGYVTHRDVELPMYRVVDRERLWALVEDEADEDVARDQMVG